MAGSRIKGITIEIDGNTSKLQKALSSVDKSLKDTQTTLRDVDKLLKLDPKNTELLSQKQKALGDAVNLTKQRQREFGSVASQVIAEAGRKVQEFGGKVEAAGQKLAPLSAAAGGFAAGMIGLGYSSITAADDLNTLSKQTGISTDSLQKMKYASDLVDVSVEDITGAFTKMKKGMSGSADAFDEIGVSVTNADGSMRDAEDVFNDTLKALSEIENETERDQKAYAIFGKSADQLAGIIDDGGEALRQYGNQAEELGLIMSGDTLDSLNEINDKVDESKAQISAAAGELGATIAEGLLPLVDPIVEGIQKVTEFIKNLTPEQTNLILAIAGVIAVVAPLLSIIGGIISTVGTIMTMAPAISAALAALSGPIGLVIAAIAALIAIIVVCIAHWDEIKAKVQEVWSSVVDYVTQLKDDVAAKFEEIKNKISEKLTEIKSKFTEKFDEIKAKVKGVIDDIKGFFENLKLKIPKIELPSLPKFKIEGEFSLNPPSVPHISVDWNAKAMQNPYLFTKPTLFGAGEAGPEVMYGKNALMRDIASASAANNEQLIDGFYSAMVEALKETNLTVQIGRREFGRIVREVG